MIIRESELRSLAKHILNEFLTKKQHGLSALFGYGGDGDDWGSDDGDWGGYDDFDESDEKIDNEDTGEEDLDALDPTEEVSD